MVLAALGGVKAPCVELVTAWGAHEDDLQVLLLGPRGPDDELDLDESMITEARAGAGQGSPAMRFAGSGWVATAGPPAALPPAGAQSGAQSSSAAAAQSSSAAAALLPAIAPPAGVRPAPQPGQRRLVRGGGASVHIPLQAVGPGRSYLGASMLAMVGAHDPEWAQERERRLGLFSAMALGHGFQVRLVGTVAASWASRSATGERIVPALVAALAGRVAPSVAEWLVADPEEVEVTVFCGSGWGEATLSPTGRPSVALPLDWLARVWAAGLAVVEGYLVVAVLEAHWPEATVLGLYEPGREPQRLGLRFEAGSWELLEMYR